MFTFYRALITLRKVCIQLFSLQLWANRGTDHTRARACVCEMNLCRYVEMTIRGKCHKKVIRVDMMKDNTWKNYLSIMIFLCLSHVFLNRTLWQFFEKPTPEPSFHILNLTDDAHIHLDLNTMALKRNDYTLPYRLRTDQNINNPFFSGGDKNNTEKSLWTLFVYLFVSLANSFLVL